MTSRPASTPTWSTRTPTASAPPSPFAELRIAKPDGSTAAPGEEGELVHAGPLVARGYWNDSERTAARFRTGEVWSSDTMVLGGDGLLRFRGRDDAMIKSSGNRISPTKIEEAALASGAAGEAAAFGLPDPQLGQSIALIAVPAGADSESRLRTHFAAELPAFIRPSRIVLVYRFPLGSNGKVDRAALRAIIDGEGPR